MAGNETSARGAPPRTSGRTGGVKRWMELDEREVGGKVGTDAPIGAEEVRKRSAADDNRGRQQTCWASDREL